LPYKTPPNILKCMCLSFNYIISSFIYIVNTVHYKIHYHEKIYLLLKIEKNIILCYNYLIKEAFLWQ